MRRAVLAVLLAGLALTACSHGPSVVAPPAAKPGRAVVLVSLGGDETAGGDLDYPEVITARWPQVLFAKSLPTRTVFVNVGQIERRVDDGRLNQLPLALDAHPTIATVWFGAADDALGTSASRFTQDLAAIIEGLDAAGARVFVATQTGTRYDAAIAATVERLGATAVPVSGLPSPLGAAGHAEAAARFATAIGTVT